MSTRKRKQSIKLNNTDSLQGLMQEAYNDACSQIIDTQKLVNELSLTMIPTDIDDLTKISREKSNALKLKDSAIKMKIEMGKILNDIIKHNGSIEDTDATRIEQGSVPTADAFKEIRNLIKASKEE